MTNQCRGAGYPVGGPYFPKHFKSGVRAVCPECGKDLAATFRSLGTRGSGCGYEAVVPKHTRPRPGQSIITGLKQAVEWAGTQKKTCACGAPLAFATGIGEYCTAGFKCTEGSGLQKPESTWPHQKLIGGNSAAEAVPLDTVIQDPYAAPCNIQYPITAALLEADREAQGIPAPASPELTALLEDLHRDPRKYRLTNLETGTTWAFTVRDGKLVPEREVCPK